MKLRVRNFQAIEDAKLNVQGFTVITGKSNTGKTALTRAVSALLFGLTGDHFVKRGTDWAGAHLHLEDDPPLKVTWRKVPTAKKRPGLQSALDINGRTFTKTGTAAQHRQITAEHGIKELEAGNSKLRPQAAAQHDPIFLITESEANAAEVLKMLGRADTVNEAQGLTRKDLRASLARKDLREEDQKRAQTLLDELAEVPNHAANWELLNRLYLQPAEELRQKREELSITLKELSNEAPIELPTEPVLPDSQRKENTMKLIKELMSLKEATLPEVPPPPVDKKEKAKEKLRELGQLLVEARKISLERENTLEEIEQLHRRTEELKKLIGECPTCGKTF